MIEFNWSNRLLQKIKTFLVGSYFVHDAFAIVTKAGMPNSRIPLQYKNIEHLWSLLMEELNREGRLVYLLELVADDSNLSEDRRFEAKQYWQQLKLNSPSIDSKPSVSNLLSKASLNTSSLFNTVSDRSSVYNLDILLTRANESGRYQIHIIESPTNQTKEPSTQFLAPKEIKELLLYTQNLVAELGDMKELGKKLYEFLFPPAIKTIFDKSYGRLQDNGLLRIRLRWGDFTVMDELSRLPWEYMHDGDSFLALDRKLSIVRYHHGRQPGPLAVPDTLRILAVASAPRNQKPLDLEKELSALTQVSDSFQQQKVELRIERNVTPRQLRLAINEFQPHVLHYAGHGRRGEKMGELLLCDEGENTSPIPADYLQVMLKDGPVRIAILNGCDTAANPTADAAIYSISGQLVDAGLPAVIGMQYELPDKIAPYFLTDLYAAIANNLPLDQALTETRIGLYVDWQNKNFWALPALFLRLDDSQVFSK